MRLLNTETLRLESFVGSSIPRYAILSHTWDEEEVLFGDICDPSKPLPVDKKGFAKIQGSCQQASQHGYEFIWIDTCCIDKSSSAELSEAINSMFQWYQDSARCYAYLADIEQTQDSGAATDIKDSRWFTRGWTLQELIAPRSVLFYDSRWNPIGERDGSSDSDALTQIIRQRTGIPTRVLRWPRLETSYPRQSLESRLSGPSLSRVLDSCSIAQKMSWAAHRSTTRVEDEAYSLLGIFGVNMPMLYGEGRRAFFRLQQEILISSNDQSILAFTHPPGIGILSGGCELLAHSPRSFADSLIELPAKGTGPGSPDEVYTPELSPSPKSIEIELYLCPVRTRYSSRRTLYLGILSCSYRGDLTSRPAIVLEPIDGERRIFYRTIGHVLKRISPMDMNSAKRIPIKWVELLPQALSQSTFETVRLHLRPPTETPQPSPNRILAGPTQALAPAMSIKLQTHPSCSLLKHGSHPQALEFDKDGNQIYAPSMVIIDLQEQHGDRERIALGKPPDRVRIFGVILLELAGLGVIDLRWGLQWETDGGHPWFNIVSEALVGTVLVPGPKGEEDLNKVAHRAYEAEICNWEDRPEILGLPGDTVVTINGLSWRVKSEIQAVPFFGGRVFNLNLTMEKMEKGNLEGSTWTAL